MALYAIGDLHLGLSVDKPMDIFGPGWSGHVQRLEAAFSQLHDEDVTVLCGDTSWGMDFTQSLADFRFIDALPGKKLLLKGNHDYWWNTAAKMKRFFEENNLHTLDILHNNCHIYGDYALCGTRGWFFEEERGGHNEKMRAREALRLTASLQAGGDRTKLVFLHYPPLYEGYQCQEILEVLEREQPALCCYGHLHGPSHSRAFQGMRRGTKFRLVAADYLHFQPVKLLDE